MGELLSDGMASLVERQRGMFAAAMVGQCLASWAGWGRTEFPALPAFVSTSVALTEAELDELLRRWRAEARDRPPVVYPVAARPRRRRRSFREWRARRYWRKRGLVILPEVSANPTRLPPSAALRFDLTPLDELGRRRDPRPDVKLDEPPAPPPRPLRADGR
jgi:hypothetical protein